MEITDLTPPESCKYPRMCLIGLTFGRLRVAKFVGKRVSKPHWLCVCDCGKEKIVAGTELKKGATMSCGCLARELTSTRSTKHGHKRGYRSAEYGIWAGIKHRCHNRFCKEYPKYGERGIKVCDRWINSFENFFADMGDRPSPKHSIDRIDNNGHYEPSNCRWATNKTQGRNRRSNRNIEYLGRTQCLSAWCEELGIRRDSVKWLAKMGLSDSEALSVAVKKKEQQKLLLLGVDSISS